MHELEGGRGVPGAVCTLSAFTGITRPSGWGHTLSRAKVPFFLGAAEATYGPHGTFGLPVPHDPSDSLSLHPATGDALAAAQFGAFGAPPGSRSPLPPPVPGPAWEQGWGWAERFPAPGRKVCKESTAHRLPGVSEGKFMHRL